ncbi:MAG: hypothetical protein H0U91_03650 [Rubrobacter sp.]|nr:hypothetical protein [Rubrobacter sp.]MBA3951968.1 hypothetical protein [Rubrobacter sp.]MDQ3360143.1 hypothetical protein [Actinomycetota bacterium]
MAAGAPNTLKGEDLTVEEGVRTGLMRDFLRPDGTLGGATSGRYAAQTLRRGFDAIHEK